MMRSIWSCLFVLFILVGCANRPVTVETAKPINPNKQFLFSKKTKYRNALLSFVRNNGLVGSTCESKILINDKLVGEVGTGKIINIYLKPGKHKVKIMPTSLKLCGGDEYESVVSLKKDSENHFRVAILQKLDIEPISKASKDHNL